MNRIFTGLLGIVLLTGTHLTAAQAEPYISGSLGYVDLEDSDVNGPFGDVGNTEVTFDGGIGALLAFGYAAPNGLRGEVELAYRYNDVDSLDDPYGSYSINDVYISSGALMINGYWDMLPSQPFSPFIGGGVGFATVAATFDDDVVYYHDGYYYYIDDYDSEEDTVLAYQLMGGFSFAINPRVNIDVQYRYFASDDPDFDGVEIEYKTHNGLIGLRYKF